MTTMVIQPSHIERLNECISKASRTVIVTHMKPDGDAMGSALAMYHFLKKYFHVTPEIVLNDRFQSCLEFLIDQKTSEDIHIFSEDQTAATESIETADLIICLDFNAFHRTDRLCRYLERSNAVKILIDHHLNPDLANFDLTFSETAISSASELLYQILMAMPQINGEAGALPTETAAALMTGMTTDTNNFANSVYPSTLVMASTLLAAGVDRDYILDRLFNQYGENRLRLMGHMMKDLLTITEDGAAYMILDQKTLAEYDIKEGDTEGFVNMPLSIAGVRMSLLFKEDGNKIRVSIRSKKGTSANMCARLYFNGGGHENAAGGRLEIPITQAEEYIRHHVHKYFTENES